MATREVWYDKSGDTARESRAMIGANRVDTGGQEEMLGVLSGDILLEYGGWKFSEELTFSENNYGFLAACDADIDRYRSMTLYRPCEDGHGKFIYLTLAPGFSGFSLTNWLYDTATLDEMWALYRNGAASPVG